MKNSEQLAKAGFEPPIVRFQAHALNYYAIHQLGGVLHFSFIPYTLYCLQAFYKIPYLPSQKNQT